MKIKISHIKDIAVIAIDGKININSSKLIEAVGLLLEKGTSKIIVDMRNVDFVDYNGLSVLAITYKNALNYKSLMKLCNISLHIQELLKVVKLDDVFEIYDSLNDALLSFQHEGDGLVQHIEHEQPLRRRFTRLEMDVPVTYKLVKGLCIGSESHLYCGRMENISGAGLFLRTIHMLPLGSEVAVEVVLDSNKEPKRFNGIVMWLADKGIQPELYPGMGISFTDISSRSQVEILEFIERHTVHRKG
jgi:anti-sigma B factor antagonist